MSWDQYLQWVCWRNFLNSVKITHRPSHPLSSSWALPCSSLSCMARLSQNIKENCSSDLHLVFTGCLRCQRGSNCDVFQDIFLPFPTQRSNTTLVLALSRTHINVFQKTRLIWQSCLIDTNKSQVCSHSQEHVYAQRTHTSSVNRPYDCLVSGQTD